MSAAGFELGTGEAAIVLQGLDLLAQRLRANGAHHSLPPVDRLSRRVAELIVTSAPVPPLAPTCSTPAGSQGRTVAVRLAAMEARKSREYITRLARQGRIDGELTAAGWQIDVDSLERWMRTKAG